MDMVKRGSIDPTILPTCCTLEELASQWLIESSLTCKLLLYDFLAEL